MVSVATLGVAGRQRVEVVVVEQRVVAITPREGLRTCEHMHTAYCIIIAQCECRVMAMYLAADAEVGVCHELRLLGVRGRDEAGVCHNANHRQRNKQRDVLPRAGSLCSGVSSWRGGC